MGDFQNFAAQSVAPPYYHVRGSGFGVWPFLLKAGLEITVGVFVAIAGPLVK